MAGNTVKIGTGSDYATYTVLVDPVTGNPITSIGGPGAGAAVDTYEPLEVVYSAILGTSQYAIGEYLSNVWVFNDAGSVAYSRWYNLSRRTVIFTAPPDSHLAARGCTNYSTISNPASSTTSAVVLAANPLRKGARILNNSTSIFYGLYGSSVASSTLYSFVLAPLTASPIVPVGLPSYEDIPANWIGPVSGVWAAANGNLLITEFV